MIRICEKQGDGKRRSPKRWSVSKHTFPNVTLFQVGKLLRGSRRRRRCLLIVDEEDGDVDVC